MKQNKKTVEEPDFVDVFFKEVSEDVQNDNIKAFWKKYGVQIVAFVAICLTIAVSFETIKHWRDVQNQKWSDAFAYAQLLQKQGKYDDSLKLLAQIADDGNAIYADEAQLKTVNILLEQNKKDEAIAKLENFIKSGYSKKLKNAALIKLATFKADTASSEEITALLQPLTADGNGIWQLEAMELIALTHLKEGHEAQALAIYQNIVKSYDITDILRARAQNMISVLTSGENK